MENMLIRDATVADIRALCVLRNSVAAHEAKLLEAERGTVRFLVAAAGDEIVGFATLFLAHPKTGPAKSHIPKLSDCFVATNYRSRGIGRALVSARESIARLERHTRLFVSVDPVENPRWFDFFRRRGYTALHAEPYRKRERRHSKDGEIEEVLVWRQDLVVDLDGPAGHGSPADLLGCDGRPDGHRERG
ncbi:GNAT family N-acetyltransferase [Candidatus Fermentibacteria bacterium]|nr:GNAT family N-acetyltransferase [Candidatus Fermentibacteria bacterium]